jgi:hypothetical protein
MQELKGSGQERNIEKIHCCGEHTQRHKYEHVLNANFIRYQKRMQSTGHLSYLITIHLPFGVKIVILNVFKLTLHFFNL